MVIVSKKQLFTTAALCLLLALACFWLHAHVWDDYGVWTAGGYVLLGGTVACSSWGIAKTIRDERLIDAADEALEQAPVNNTPPMTSPGSTGLKVPKPLD